MAEVILADGDFSHNRSSSDSLSADLKLSKHLLDLTEDFISGLSHARTLLAVSQYGLSHCNLNTQREYIRITDSFIEGAMLSFMEIVEMYRDKDEDGNK